MAWAEGWVPLLKATENLRVAIEKKNLNTNFSYSDFEVLRPYERAVHTPNLTGHGNASSTKVVVRGVYICFGRGLENGIIGADVVPGWQSHQCMLAMTHKQG